LLAPIQVVIVGSGMEANRLEALATARYAVNKTVIRLNARQLVAETLPDALASTLTQVPVPYSAQEAWALVCIGHTCLPPVTDSESLLEALERSV